MSHHSDISVYMESLGCARNQVDSEMMLARLQAAGWQISETPEAAHLIVVNTCSFIESAADESIDTILALAEHKRGGACRRLIVAGCLPERYREPITGALPEVDLFLGTGAYDRIVEAAQGALADGQCLLPDPDAIDTQQPATRQASQPHSAYLKIAEGCDRHCTYCIIPRLRGRQKSRSAAAILAEARQLIAAGARELTLVAQETTAYGQDRGEIDGLSRLLSDLAGLDPDVWIRFLYGHPQSMTPAVVQAVAAHANLCAYFDLPVQHASDPVLRRMGRSYRRSEVDRLVEQIRDTIPDAALRTTVIVGFPGETEKDVDLLCDWTAAVGFDHLGVFTYSDAEDLAAHRLSDPVPAKVARQRHDRLMAQQRRISSEKLTRYRQRCLDILLEHRAEEGLYFGRSQFQGPEVDGMTMVRTAASEQGLAIGQVVPVTIFDTLEYDLIGKVSCKH